MAFWKKKEKDEGQKCPLCGTPVSLEDVECSLCFYQLKLSPRHQSLNITPNEEDGLIGLLNSDIEEDEEEEVIEVEDVINLNSKEITIEAKYDEEDLISVPSEQAPQFVTNRMTPQGVNDSNENEEDFEINFDLNDMEDIEQEHEKDLAYEESKMENLDPLPTPPPPAPPELPTPPPPAPLEEKTNPYEINKNITKMNPSEINKTLLNEGSIWPWTSKEEWSAKNLRDELLNAMNAAKSGNNSEVEKILERIGPHLGENIDLIFHVGVLLKRIGREYELIQMLSKAQMQYPNNTDVINAFSKLK